MDRRQPTLIVFARRPLPHRTKTRLARMVGATGAARLAAAFALDALAKARELCPARLVIAGEAAGGAGRNPYFRALARRFGAELVDQGAGALGARMARVMAPYAEGGAILIGTDTPSIPARLLKRSVALLARYPVVIGPSLDGGYYLIGARGKLPDVFRGIRWGGGRVLADTIARLRRLAVGYGLGPAWYDVDRPADLSLLATHIGLMLNRRRGKDRDAIPCPQTAQVLKRLGLLRLAD